MHDGVVTTENGSSVGLRVVDAGRIHVPSGLVEACDPFVNLGEAAVFPIPPGTYPVFVTIADVSDEQDGSHEREAYLSIKVADGEIHSVRGAESTKGIPDDDVAYGVPVDAGTVGFVDHEAVPRYMPKDVNWYDEFFDNPKEDSWFSLMDSEDHIAEGIANIVLPGAANGENVVLCHSGWGDGFYSVLGSYDVAGSLLGLHIELIAIGGMDAENDDAEPQAAVKAPGFWHRLLRGFSR